MFSNGVVFFCFQLATLLSALVYSMRFLGPLGPSGQALFAQHPTFHFVGWLGCVGLASQMYLVLDGRWPRPTIKLVHGFLMSFAGLCFLLATVAVFQFHSEKEIPHFYSLHAYLGLATLLLFSAQFAVALVVFACGGARDPSRRQALAPWHRLMGPLIFLSATITMVVGVAEKQLFIVLLPGGDKFSGQQKFANWLALLLLAFALTFLVRLLSAVSSRSNASVTLV